MSDMEYTYERLDPNSRCIRLLSLQPINASDIIDYRLLTFPLEECPPYVAVSYTWGSPKDSVSIQVDGKPFLVRKNLWSFLDTMRSDKRWQLFWVDAICIHQSNAAERNHQVNMMRDIYALASLVVVWLGPAANSSDLAIEYIANGNLVPVAAETNLHSAVCSILERAYWRRAWMVEELMLARDVIFFSGRKSFTWHQIASFRQKLKTGEHRDTSGTKLLATQCYSAVAESPGWFMIAQKITWGHCDNHLPLSSLLQVFQNLESTDPMDRVYGLLGLATETSIKVDYTIPVEILYRKVLRAIGMAHRSMHSLATVEHALQRMLRLDDCVARFLAAGYPHTLNSMARLKSTYQQQGQWKEVLDIRRQLLGERHPDTLEAMAVLASIYHQHGQSKEAEQEVNSAAIVYYQQTQHYFQQNRWKEAEELQIKMLDLQRKILGEKHTGTLETIARLASTYRQQCRWEEAEELQIKVLDLRREILGEKHVDTLNIARLALIYV